VLFTRALSHILRPIVALSGWTVGQYITWWRMQLAWQQLQSGGAVANVADNVGYKSEAAFSRALKKVFEVSPGRVRRGAECE